MRRVIRLSFPVYAASTVACGGRASIAGPSGRCAESSTSGMRSGAEGGSQTFTRGVRGHYEVVRDSSGTLAHGFVAFLRGQSDWDAGPFAGSDRRDENGRRVIQASYGSGRIVMTFEPSRNALRFGTTEVALDSADVVLLDRVDSIGGPPVIRSVGCISLVPTSSVIGRALTAFPEARGFTLGQ